MSRTHDLVVLGAGAAGLTVAGGAAQLGLRVALVERQRMGGECLNSGCVPSKALIAAARRAHAMRTASGFGIAPVEPEIDFSAVHAAVHEAIATIAPHDSEERFRGFGVEVIRGSARFVDARSVEVGGRRLTAPRIVIAVGSRPAVPSIDGLAAVPYLTNETVFDLRERPRHLLILGGGAVGLEMAQAFRRLGSEVTVIEADRPLAHEDPAAAQVVLAALTADGVTIRAGWRAARSEATAQGVTVVAKDGAAVHGSHLLLAVGRTPALDGLGLNRAGVAVTSDGIRVDARRRTSNPRVYAVGDCRDGARFTHLAGHDGEVAIRNVCFGLPARVEAAAVPRVTYTDPELAQLGLTEAEARARHRSVRVFTEPFSDNDRAVTERATTGFLKLVMAGRRVVGVTIVGEGAGDLLLPWTLAMRRSASAWAITGAIIPYPTRSELSKAGAFLAYRGAVFGRWARLFVRLRSRLLR